MDWNNDGKYDWQDTAMDMYGEQACFMQEGDCMEQLTSEEKKEIRKLKIKIAMMQIAVFSVKAFNVIKRIVIFIFTLAFQVIKLVFLAMYYALLIAVKICVGLAASNNTSSAKRYNKPRKRTRREYEEDDDELTIDEMMIIDEIWTIFN